MAGARRMRRTARLCTKGKPAPLEQLEQLQVAPLFMVPPRCMHAGCIDATRAFVVSRMVQFEPHGDVFASTHLGTGMPAW